MNLFCLNVIVCNNRRSPHENYRQFFDQFLYFYAEMYFWVQDATNQLNVENNLENGNTKYLFYFNET